MSNKKSNKIENTIVIQSNNLVESYYDTDLNATEHKIVRYAYSKIKKAPEIFPKVEFTINEFLEVAGFSSQSYYSKVAKISEELSKKIIKVKTDQGAKWIPWFSEIDYSSGKITISFNEKIRDLLVGVEQKGQYLRYDFKYLTDMKSGYTIRLYELLKQYAPIKKRRLSVDVLKQMLGIADKYDQYGQFKLRVLKQAQKELDKKGELTFTFEEIKEGRRVTDLIFYIETKDDRLIKSVNKDVAERKAFAQEVKFLFESHGYKIDDNMIKQWSIYDIDMINDAVQLTKNANMHSPQHYIDTVLKDIYKEVNAIKKNIKIDGCNIDNYREVKMILDFINHYQFSKEVIPEWFYEKKFIEMFEKNKYSKNYASKIWKDNEKYLLDEIKKYRHIFN